MKIDARPLFSLTKKSRFARIDNVFINMQIHNTQRCQSGLTPKPTSLLSGTPRIIRPLDFEEICRGVRAVECARLESVCGESYLGFESRPLRQIKQGEKNERTNFYWRGMAICKQLVACRSLGSAFARRYFGKILSSKRCRSHVCVWF